MKIEDLPILELSSPEEVCEYILNNVSHPIENVGLLMTKTAQLKAVKQMVFINQGWQVSYKGHIIISRIWRSWLSTPVHSVFKRETLSARIITTLNSQVAAPWYIFSGGIRLWSSQAHFDLSMVDYDLEHYCRMNVS